MAWPHPSPPHASSLSSLLPLTSPMPHPSHASFLSSPPWRADPSHAPHPSHASSLSSLPCLLPPIIPPMPHLSHPSHLPHPSHASSLPSLPWLIPWLRFAQGLDLTKAHLAKYVPSEKPRNLQASSCITIQPRLTQMQPVHRIRVTFRPQTMRPPHPNQPEVKHG